MAAAGSLQPNYGLDAPRLVRHMFSRAAWTLLTALVLYFINRQEYPGPALRMAGVIALIGLGFLAVGGVMIWSSRVAKLRLRDRMLDSLALEGSERVLDAGCGLGLLAIGAAKRLNKAGRVIGIDNWDPTRLSGSSMEAARENAKREGIGEKVRFETSDLTRLSYPNDNFDVVVSSLAIHNLPEHEQRVQAVLELHRVLKPGGKLLIHDVLHTADYAKILKQAGAQDINLSGTSLLWCVPSRTLTARK
jgi:arsenite methyltransferase